MDRRAFVLSSLAGLSLRPLFAQDLQSDLQLELRQEQTGSDRPRFSITFHNRATSPLVLDVGTVVGEKRYANGIDFTLRDSSNRVRRLTKRDPQYIAGSAGPYIVDVPAGEAFHLNSIDLADYWSHEPKIAILHVPAGLYSLTADFQGRDPNKGFVPAPGQSPIHGWPQTFWTGNIRSNAIEVTFSSPMRAK